MVHTSLEHSTKRRHKQQRCDGACDNGTHDASCSQEFSRRRQITTSCENNPCGLKHERQKGPYKPSEDDEKTCQNKYISVKVKWTRCTFNVQKKSATLMNLWPAFARPPILSQQISPSKNIHVESYTNPSRKPPFKTHVKRDSNCPSAMKKSRQ